MIRRGVLFASLLATVPAMRAFAQARPTPKGQATTTVSPQVLAAMQQRATVPVSWPAPQPCVGAPTITHGRRGDSIPVPELRKGSLQQAQAILARMHLNIDARSVPMSRSANLVVAQSPPTGAIVASGDTVIVCWLAPPVSVPPDTSTVGVVPPPPVVQMPRLIGRSYATAAAMIRALPLLSRIRPRAAVRGVNNQPFEPTRSLVDSQRPTAGAALTAQDAIEVVFRDTTTMVIDTPTPDVVPPPPVVQMPRFIGRSYATAVTMLRALPVLSRIRPRVAVRGVNDQPFEPTRSLVDSQRPRPGAVLTAQDAIEVVFRDTTTLLVFTPPKPQPQTPSSLPQPQPQPIQTQQFQPPPQSLPQLSAPPPPRTQRQAQMPSPPRTQRQSQTPSPPPAFPAVSMPLVTGRMYDAAADTLRKLIQLGGLTLTPGRRGINRTGFTLVRSVVDSQLPAAGTLLTRQSVVLLIVRDTVLVASTTTQDGESSFWKWIIAAGVLLAVAATTVAVKQSGHRAEQKHLVALQVIPHLDVGRPRVVFTIRDGERAEDAFARVGLSIRAVTDLGKPLLHFPRPPRTRDETTHV